MQEFTCYFIHNPNRSHIFGHILLHISKGQWYYGKALPTSLMHNTPTRTIPTRMKQPTSYKGTKKHWVCVGKLHLRVIFTS